MKVSTIECIWVLCPLLSFNTLAFFQETANHRHIPALPTHISWLLVLWYVLDLLYVVLALAPWLAFCLRQTIRYEEANVSDNGWIPFFVRQPPLIDLRNTPQLGEVGAECQRVDMTSTRVSSTLRVL